MTDARPFTTKLKSRDLPGWVAVFVVAAGGLLGSWMSYDRGAAVADTQIENLTARVKLLEEKNTTNEKRLTILEVKFSTHNHRKK